MAFGKTKQIGDHSTNNKNANFDHFSAIRFVSSYIDFIAGVFIPCEYGNFLVEYLRLQKESLTSYSLLSTCLSHKSLNAIIRDFLQIKITKQIASMVIVEVKNMEFMYSRNVLASQMRNIQFEARSVAWANRAMKNFTLIRLCVGPKPNISKYFCADWNNFILIYNKESYKIRSECDFLFFPRILNFETIDFYFQANRLSM